MKTEIWKDIENYEGLYMISNMGNVKSLNYNHTDKTKLLKPCKDKYGYYYVVLCDGICKKAKKIHRLVAIEFIPNIENKATVNHKNHIKTDNNVENLEWNTTQENTRHAIINGLKPTKAVIQLNIDGEFISEYESINDAAISIKTNLCNIVNCLKGRQKTAGGYKWEYKTKK